jgi:iron complex transport system substrate-binding protein
MKHLRSILAVSLCALAIAALGACGKKPDAPTAPQSPQRIVSLSPAVTEILYELGLGDKIVGDTRYCNYPPDAEKKQKVGDLHTVKEEQILALKPDLIIDTTSKEHEQMWKRMEAAGIRVERFDINTIEGIYSAYAGIGKATNTEEKAKELAGALKQGFADLRARTRNAQRPTTLFVVDPENFVVAGKGTFVDGLLSDIACLNPIQQPDWPGQPVMEEIIRMKPAVVIYSLNSSDLTAENETKIRNDLAKKLPNVPAVRDNRIFFVNADITTRPGPRMLKGWTEIAKLVHPELFN